MTSPALSSASVPSPDELLDELGISEPSEIDLETIAAYCGATIVHEPLDGCAAQIVGHGDRAIITVDARARRERRRFSAAHELGHWMHDRGRVAFACTTGNFTRDWHEGSRERRANRYGAELLLPTKIFGPRARGLPATLEATRELASTFETSLTATAIRLVELGAHLAMVVCCDGGKLAWFARSRDVPRALWPVEHPGQDTVAAQLLTDAAKVGPRHVSADEWISHEDAHRYTIHEDSVVVQPNLTLTLLWWDDEQQILDFEDAESDDREPLTGHLSFPARRRR